MHTLTSVWRCHGSLASFDTSSSDHEHIEYIFCDTDIEAIGVLQRTQSSTRRVWHVESCMLDRHQPFEAEVYLIQSIHQYRSWTTDLKHLTIKLPSPSETIVVNLYESEIEYIFVILHGLNVAHIYMDSLSVVCRKGIFWKTMRYMDIVSAPSGVGGNIPPLMPVRRRVDIESTPSGVEGNIQPFLPVKEHVIHNSLSLNEELGNRIAERRRHIQETDNVSAPSGVERNKLALPIKGRVRNLLRIPSEEIYKYYF
ncbi:unnamed protein product, partial [Meganyctiphanes norvegica]